MKQVIRVSDVIWSMYLDIWNVSKKYNYMDDDDDDDDNNTDIDEIFFFF